MIFGVGVDIVVFVVYNEICCFSKILENFGKGEIKVVVFCEVGVNGCIGGVLLFMLMLGIFGDVVIVIMLGVLMLQGM